MWSQEVEVRRPMSRSIFFTDYVLLRVDFSALCLSTVFAGEAR